MSDDPAPFRRGVASRLFAALVGGLLATNAVAAMLSFLIPNRLDAYFITGALSGLPLVGALLWAFHARSASRAWAVMLGIAGYALLLAILLRFAEAGA